MLTVRIRDHILQHAYMSGYAGRLLPRPVRRLIAGSAIHRAWFLGHTGHFSESDTRYGLANPYQHGQQRGHAE